ncbi:hypothetical protein B0H13DRAFT_1857296 [Mycena leptocephala]|nr:hypothetical protein B0H13DRAFT_1857296 [Mycena leptocephala]
MVLGRVETNTLFLEIDSDSDIELPPSISLPTISAPLTASTISSSSGTTSIGSLPIATSVSSLATTASGPSPLPIPLHAAVTSNVVSFGPPSILAPTGTRSSRYFGGALSAAGASASSSSSIASSSALRPLPFPRTSADYAAETAAMEAFNEFGNYREVTPKRTFDTAILESSGFKSPERPSYNPWKRQRKSLSDVLVNTIVCPLMKQVVSYSAVPKKAKSASANEMVSFTQALIAFHRSSARAQFVVARAENHARALKCLFVQTNRHRKTVCMKYTEELRVLLSQPDIVQKIVPILNSATSGEESSVIQALILFLEDDLLRAPYSTVEIIQKIIAQLDVSDDSDFGRNDGGDQLEVLNAIGVCFKHDSLRAIISGPEMVQKIVTMLDSGRSRGKGSALGALALFLENDSLCVPYSRVEIIEKTIVNLGSSWSIHERVRRRARKVVDICLKHDATRALMSTPQILEFILTQLSGGYRDEKIELIGQLIAQAQSSAQLRKSYTKVILLLRISVTISRDDAHNLTLLLRNTDPTIVRAASEIVAHFTANRQFRDYLLDTEIWNLLGGLLRRQQGPEAALQMVAAFAKHENTRRLIMNPTFEIVSELLNMLKAGSTDFDRWEVGLKGLLALGLF